MCPHRGHRRPNRGHISVPAARVGLLQRIDVHPPPAGEKKFAFAVQNAGAEASVPGAWPLGGALRGGIAWALVLVEGRC